MRISSTERWLAVALSLGIGPVNGADEPGLFFDTPSFQGIRPEFPIFMIPEGVLLSKQFGWTTSGKLRVETVRLYSNITGNEAPIGTANKVSDGGNMAGPAGGAGGSGSIGSGKPKSTFPTKTSASQSSSSTQAEPRKRSVTPADDVKLTLNSDLSGAGFVTIDNMAQLGRYSKDPLYFVVDWTGPGVKNKTNSQFFAFVNNQEEFDEIVSNPTYMDLLSQPPPELAEPATVSGTSTPTNPSATQVFPSGFGSASQPEDSSPSGGLATGAVIGIAVACGIIGLVLIGALIWFLFRRRRQTTNVGGPGRPYGIERNRTEELMAEKEASAGADPSPHSPYSDEGILVGGPAGTHHEGAGIPAGAVAPVLAQQVPRLQQPHDQPRSYTPYSDRASGGAVGSPSTHAASIAHSEDTSRAGMGSPTAGRAGSLAPQYAHLVEEGMTEEEIRRLEDEERQLDAAIEQAGRR